jgi:hypothetical protein
VRRKGFARKLGWVCYGTLRRVHVRLTNTRLTNIPNYTHNAQGTQLCPILRAASDSTLILTARSRISRAKFFISSVQRCWESYFAANVQRQYAEDAKVETSFSARCGISRCRGTTWIVALLMVNCRKIRDYAYKSLKRAGSAAFWASRWAKRIQSMGSVSRWTFKISTRLRPRDRHRNPSVCHALLCGVRLPSRQSHKERRKCGVTGTLTPEDYLIHFLYLPFSLGCLE